MYLKVMGWFGHVERIDDRVTCGRNSVDDGSKMR